MWLLLAEVAKGMTKGEYNEFIIDFLSTLCMRGGTADQEVQEWVGEMLIGDGKEPSALAWPIRLTKSGTQTIFVGKLAGILPEYKPLSAESKSLGHKAAKSDDIKKTIDICKEINNINQIRKDLADDDNWVEALEFLPSSRQALGFEKKRQKSGMAAEFAKGGFDGSSKITVGAKVMKKSSTTIVEGMDPNRKRQVRYFRSLLKLYINLLKGRNKKNEKLLKNYFPFDAILPMMNKARSENWTVNFDDIALLNELFNML